MDILIEVITNSSKSEVVEEIDNYLKIKLKSAPVEGRANTELIKLLAKKYQVAKSQIKILKGIKTRNKLIRIYN